MSDLLSFARFIERKGRAIEKAASKAAVDTAMAIVSDLAMVTPVDTSQALSNWLVSLDTPAGRTIGPYYPGKHGSSKLSSATETIQQAKNVLINKRPGQAIFISNYLPYIKRLNEGWSSQAPAGFVERSIFIGRKILSTFKIKV